MMFDEVNFAEKLRNVNIKIQIVVAKTVNSMWSEYVYIFFFKLQCNCIIQYVAVTQSRTAIFPV